MATNTKRILVAGGAGFLGYHLCKRLLQEGHVVYCLDNLATGSRDTVKLFEQHPNFSFLLGDVVNTLPKFNDTIDEIYNLACPASPIAYQRDPIQTFKTAVLGALNLLDLAKLKNARFLQASTSEVYGDPLEHPQKETYWGNVNPIGVRSCYDEGKRAAETICMDYHRQYGVSIRIARIFNTYGPMMRRDDGRVISNFIVQALRGEPLTIYGTGAQTRSFYFVDDLIEGLIRLMASGYGYANPVNLGNPEEHTVLEVAKMIIGIIGSKSGIIYNPLPQDDPIRRCPDITRAKTLLGWQATTSLEDGLRKTITYFNEILYHA